MGRRSERIEMSAGRLVALLLTAGIMVSLVVHSIVAIGFAVLTLGMPETLLWALVLLVLLGLTIQTLLAIARLVRRWRRLRRRRIMR